MRYLVIAAIFSSLFFLPLHSPISLVAGALAKTGPAVTTADTQIPLDELGDQLYPLTKEELLVEADAWLALLKQTAGKISKANLEIKQHNRLIEKKEQAEQAAAEKAAGSETAATEKAEEVVEEASEEKDEALEKMNALQAERIERVDRLNAVLSEITKKSGKTLKGGDPDDVKPYLHYIDAVSGVQVDVSDVDAAWASLYGWVASDQGGLRWLFNILKFIAVVAVFFGLSKLVGKAVQKALAFSPSNSAILNAFLINMSRRIIFIIGLLIGLSMLEINIGPVVAIIGAAGFVVAFALQNTLGNFASGIMIMFYRPFDVGDLIEVSGVFGNVKSMTLVSTSVTTLDNKLMLVPNNDIWGNTITNATKSSERRVDMLFGIGYADDIEKARQVLDKILEDHSKVLDFPERMVRLHELGDSSVNFICRPWVKTADYWDVYWDVTRQVKERFDAEGISIPFPQRDIHVYQEAAGQEEKGHASAPPPSDSDHRTSADFPDQGEDMPEG